VDLVDPDSVSDPDPQHFLNHCGTWYKLLKNLLFVNSVVRTLYRQLTGGRLDCPRYGQHWEDIGFQV
jgi:hypothetical protein